MSARFHDLNLTITYEAPESLGAYERNARTHSREQVRKVAESIRAFGLSAPILVDGKGVVVGGHAVLAAAKLLKLARVPVVRLDHLDHARVRALRITLNRLAEQAGWDEKLLAIEFEALLNLDAEIELDFDLMITGFASAEIDRIIEHAGEESPDGSEDEEFEPPVAPVSVLGDLWLLGSHRLICGDSREPEIFVALMGGEKAALGLHDPPYDCSVSGHVAKRGRHREFVMGSGELGEDFTPFLSAFLRASTAVLRPGGYQFCFIDWRKNRELQEAASAVGLELKILAIWNKGAGALGSLYRSQHELVFIFKEAIAPGITTSCWAATGGTGPTFGITPAPTLSGESWSSTPRLNPCLCSGMPSAT